MPVRRSVDGVIVNHDDFPRRTKADIELDPRAEVNRLSKGSERILRGR